jgi:subtilase family serine protease
MFYARKNTLFFAMLAAFLLACVPSVPGAEPSLKTLHGHLAGLPQGLTSTGLLPPTNLLRLAIGVPVRDQKGLDDFVAQVSDPASPNFRKFLTTEEFSSRFGPTAEDYHAVTNFAFTNGLTITATHGHRLLLDVQGPVENIQRAFHLNIRTYHHPTEARDYYAPDTEPSVDARIPIADISGLNNYSRPRPHLQMVSPANQNLATPRAGSGAGGGYAGQDFRAAYLPGVTLNGAGQTIGLLQFDGFDQSDISAYESALSLPNVPIQTILLDGFNGVPTTGANSGDIEVSLDIEMCISMAPGISGITVFEAGPSGIPNDVLTAMTTNTQIKQFSCSWGWGGGPTSTTDNLFKLMATHGQSFFSLQATVTASLWDRLPQMERTIQTWPIPPPATPTLPPWAAQP